MPDLQFIIHPLDPIFDEHSKVLVLGTMPSPKSREAGFYYGHPQNRFWRVMAQLFDEPLARSNDARRSQMLAHGIALWDVLAQCEIVGASRCGMCWRSARSSEHPTRASATRNRTT